MAGGPSVHPVAGEDLPPLVILSEAKDLHFPGRRAVRHLQILRFAQDDKGESLRMTAWESLRTTKGSGQT